MSKINKSIFKAYDIRGIYGEEFDNDFAHKLGMVIATYLKAKKLIVSRDMRPSSDELSKHLIDGIISTGCDVIDMGSTSTPLFYFGVISENTDGGIMITASHLGDEFNGFKITSKGAESIGGEKLLENTTELFDTKIEDGNEPGKIFKKDFLKIYTEEILKHSKMEPGSIKIPIKFIGNEMILKEARAVANKMNISVVEKGERLSFEFDADGDRLTVISSNGEKIRGDLIGGLLAGYYFPNNKIAYDLRYSRGVLEYMRSLGIELIPSRIGHTLIKAVMRKHKIEFCGEHSGHMFFKEMGYVEVPMLAALKILNILVQTGKSIEDIISKISNWSTSEEINFTVSDRKKIAKIITGIKNKYNDADINEIDGVLVQYSDWGFLLRASNTEAKLRLIVDAKTEDILNKEKQKLLYLLEELKKDK